MRTYSFLTGEPMISCLEPAFPEGEQLKHTSFFPTFFIQFGQTSFLHLSHLNQLSANGGPGLLHTGHHPPAYGEGSEIDSFLGFFIVFTKFY